MEAVLLLNSDYSFLSTISWQKAIKLMVKNKAEVIKYTDKVITNAERTMELKVPKVLKLIYLVTKIRKSCTIYNRRTLFLRDGYECAYCKAKPSKLTVDHVLPKSRGGKTSYDNTVASCLSCNSKKGDKTPQEANMKLLKRPYNPTIMDFIRMKMKGYDLSDIMDSL